VSKVSQTEMGEIKPKKNKTNCANGNIIVLIHIFKLTQMKTSLCPMVSRAFGVHNPYKLQRKL